MSVIVVGVDGSKASMEALGWTVELAGLLSLDVLAISAVPDSPGPEFAEQRRARAAMLDTAVAEATHNGKVVVSGRLIDGDARLALQDVADEESAEMVVVGSTGDDAGPGFLHLGSVAEYLAHHLERPLVVVPLDTPFALNRILVGLDGSDASRAAAQWTATVAAAAGADVIGLSVDDPILEWTPASSVDNWRRAVEESIRDDWASPVIEAGVPLTATAVEGSHPAQAIIERAERDRADMVVVGARGVGGFTGLRAGGVAMKVLHRCPYPVVLATGA